MPNPHPAVARDEAGVEGGYAFAEEIAVRFRIQGGVGQIENYPLLVTAPDAALR